MTAAAELVQIVDAALASAAMRSGAYLACRPGCSQCCHGVFEVTALDAARLRDGLAAVEQTDPARATRIRGRLSSAEAHLGPWFPGDLASGLLTGSEEAVELFEEFANNDACPLLDPESQTCDLYTARPVLCRTFGPPVRNEAADEEGGLAVCELCFHGASAAQIAACELDSGFRPLEQQLEDEYVATHRHAGPTIVAFAFRTNG